MKFPPMCQLHKFELERRISKRFIRNHCFYELHPQLQMQPCSHIVTFILAVKLCKRLYEPVPLKEISWAVTINESLTRGVDILKIDECS